MLSRLPPHSRSDRRPVSRHRRLIPAQIVTSTLAPYPSRIDSLSSSLLIPSSSLAPSLPRSLIPSLPHLSAPQPFPHVTHTTLTYSARSPRGPPSLPPRAAPSAPPPYPSPSTSSSSPLPGLGEEPVPPTIERRLARVEPVWTDAVVRVAQHREGENECGEGTERGRSGYHWTGSYVSRE
ncbi:hypothetical protein EHS25_001509 [Saitozyma podzolica]|uniref:Uncharacterized protein n=1 Tax=Saitozyma podzolica TaxID=1890683 RepID=A0A427YG80_9TREE|nr:hypothetical protein EHS25_001509 [Saitozyma podzolica]